MVWAEPSFLAESLSLKRAEPRFRGNTNAEARLSVFLDLKLKVYKGSDASYLNSFELSLVDWTKSSIWQAKR